MLEWVAISYSKTSPVGLCTQEKRETREENSAKIKNKIEIDMRGKK